MSRVDTFFSVFIIFQFHRNEYIHSVLAAVALIIVRFIYAGN